MFLRSGKEILTNLTNATMGNVTNVTAYNVTSDAVAQSKEVVYLFWFWLGLLLSALNIPLWN
jgi:hypothetical protein